MSVTDDDWRKAEEWAAKRSSCNLPGCEMCRSSRLKQTEAYLAGLAAGRAEISTASTWMAMSIRQFKSQVETHGGDYLPEHARQMFAALESWDRTTPTPEADREN